MLCGTNRVKKIKSSVIEKKITDVKVILKTYFCSGGVPASIPFTNCIVFQSRSPNSIAVGICYANTNLIILINYKGNLKITQFLVFLRSEFLIGVCIVIL